MVQFLKNNSLILKFIIAYTILIIILPNVAKYQNLLILMGFISMFMYFNNIKMEKLNDISQTKDNFVATMIHDLKNPLIGQKRLFEILITKARRQNDEQLIEMYSQMIGSSKMMLEMVVYVLNTYKYSNGKIKYNFEECDLTKLVQETCSELTHLTPNEDILHINIKNDVNTVTADKLHLQRVISNLVSNAITYRKENTPIFVEINAENDSYKFSVTNSGYYIKPEQQTEIFKKFVSKNMQFNKISTGLGLYLAKEIISAHQGKMLINSTAEGKNTFGFTIPQKQISNELCKTRL